MRPAGLALIILVAASAAGCGGSSGSTTNCSVPGKSVSTRAGNDDYALGLADPTSSPAPVHLQGMAATTMWHVVVRICPVGKTHAVIGAPQVTVEDRTSGRRVPLPLTPQRGTFAANANLPHHASVEIRSGKSTVTLIPPTD